ncbi:MAG TPA: hypothetical protein VNG53_02070, partial [Bacteroidia bacterium]|nr:hypothetical protein [Bacteroidia bacterium]
MIDIASMKAIYAHLELDPEIETALIVEGKENDLAEIGQWMMDENLEKVKDSFESGRIKQYIGFSIPITNSIYCLYLPPFYIFCDLKVPHL